MKQPKTSDMEHVCIGNNAILVSFNYTHFIYRPAKHVPSNGTVVKIFTQPENDFDGEFHVHVRYDMDLMINSNAYEILLIWFVVIFLFIQYHFHSSQSV